MCHLGDLHRARAAQHRAMADVAVAGARHAHRALADLHERRVVDHDKAAI